MILTANITLDDLSNCLKVILQIAQVVALLYAGYKFTRKPHESLESRVSALEKKTEDQDVQIRECKESLQEGNDRFREQSRSNEVMQTCMLALIDFELSYCIHSGYDDTEDLMRAKDVLREHLARK